MAIDESLMTQFVERTGRCAFEMRSMMVESLLGGWNDSMNDFCHDPELAVPVHDGLTIRRTPLYAFDAHVRKGKRLLSEYAPLLGPGKVVPQLDLRWSGQLVGVAWRYAAYFQHGMAYRDTPWHEVRMTPEFWDLALDYDDDRSWFIDGTKHPAASSATSASPR